MTLRYVLILAVLLLPQLGDASPRKATRARGAAIDAPKVGGCRGAKLVFRGACMERNALRRRFSCPAGSTLRTKDTPPFLELFCELPSGEKTGDFVTWLRTPDASGHIQRWIHYNKPEAGEARVYHASSHKLHQIYAVRNGAMNGPGKVYDVSGTLRETLNRKDDSLHGLSEEFGEAGNLVTTRCSYRGHLLWRVDDGAQPAEACPPKGFHPSSLPNNAEQRLLSLERGDMGALAADGSEFYLSMKSSAGTGVFRLDPPSGKAKGIENTSRGPSEKQDVQALGYSATLVLPLQAEATFMKIVGGRAFLEVKGELLVASLTSRATPKVLVKGVKISSMAIDGRFIYFANRLGPDEDTPKALATGIWRIGIDGSGLAQLAKVSEEPDGLTLVVSGDSVFWADEEAGTIARTPKRGGTTQVLHRGVEPLALALDGKHLLWSERGHTSPYPYFPADIPGAIVRMPLDGSAKANVLVAAGEQAVAITCDRTHYYWSGSYGIMRMARSGGAPQYLTTQATETHSFMLRGGFVYWLDRFGNIVARMDKRARERQFGEPL